MKVTPSLNKIILVLRKSSRLVLTTLSKSNFLEGVTIKDPGGAQGQGSKHRIPIRASTRAI